MMLIWIRERDGCFETTGFQRVLDGESGGKHADRHYKKRCLCCWKEGIMDLNEAIKAHSDWKMKLRGAISAQSALDAETISKDNCCALGKWLYGESKAKFGNYPAHAECVRRHTVFHKEAGKIAAAINDKKYQEAEQMLDAGMPYTEASHAVIMAIGTLKREANI